ncbi:c-type cytochrome [Sulfurimonas sp.]
MKILVFILLFLSFLHGSDAKYKLGEKLYKSTCISCHGVDGNTDPNVEFIVNPRDLSKTILNEEQTYQIIKKGAHFWGAASDIMPSFENNFNEKDIRSLAYYVSKKFNPNVQEQIEKLYSQREAIPESKKSKMLKRGKKIYKRNCSWCHGVTAHGDGEATRNPEKSIFPYDLTKTLLTNEQMFLYVKYGGQYWGTHKDDMTGWSKKYDDYTLESVIKYIEVNFRNKNDK